MLIVNFTFQLFFQRVFGSEIFTDTLKSENYVLNTFKALRSFE